MATKGKERASRQPAARLREESGPPSRLRAREVSALASFRFKSLEVLPKERGSSLPKLDSERRMRCSCRGVGSTWLPSQTLVGKSLRSSGIVRPFARKGFVASSVGNGLEWTFPTQDAKYRANGKGNREVAWHSVPQKGMEPLGWRVLVGFGFSSTGRATDG